MLPRKSIDRIEEARDLLFPIPLISTIITGSGILVSVACFWGGGWDVRLRAGAGVRPNTSTHVARTSGEVVPSGAWGHGNDTILVALQHDLSISGPGVPELYPSVLGSRHDPLSIWCQGHRENEILRDVRSRKLKRGLIGTYPMAFKSLDTSSPLRSLVHLSRSG